MYPSVKRGVISFNCLSFTKYWVIKQVSDSLDNGTVIYRLNYRVNTFGKHTYVQEICKNGRLGKNWGPTRIRVISEFVL